MTKTFKQNIRLKSSTVSAKIFIFKISMRTFTETLRKTFQRKVIECPLNEKARLLDKFGFHKLIRQPYINIKELIFFYTTAIPPVYDEKEVDRLKVLRLLST